MLRIGVTLRVTLRPLRLPLGQGRSFFDNLSHYPRARIHSFVLVYKRPALGRVAGMQGHGSGLYIRMRARTRGCAPARIRTRLQVRARLRRARLPALPQACMRARAAPARACTCPYRLKRVMWVVHDYSYMCPRARLRRARARMSTCTCARAAAPRAHVHAPNQSTMPARAAACGSRAGIVIARQSMKPRHSLCARACCARAHILLCAGVPCREPIRASRVSPKGLTGIETGPKGPARNRGCPNGTPYTG